MRRLLALLILLAVPAWATTYYVDCASSGGDGTTTDTSGAHAAFATIAAAQAAVTGDQHDNSLLFKRGCTWREQFTVGANGTSGHQFTIGAYSTGDKPIIKGSDLITGFAAMPDWTEIWNAETQVGNSTWAGNGSANDNWRIYVKAAVTTGW